MTTIAIIGAGPGLGAAVARRFAAEGFAVGLVARSPEHLDALAAGIDGARGYPADVRDPAALTVALDRVRADLGPVDVLQYSPLPHPDFLKPVLDTTPGDLRAAVDFSLHGTAAAVAAVLPGMRERGRGSVLLVNGGSAAVANPAVTGTSVAFAAQAAYARLLHDELAPEGVHVAQLVVPGRIEPGHPHKDPAVLAERLWALHAAPGAFRVTVDG